MRTTTEERAQRPSSPYASATPPCATRFHSTWESLDQDYYHQDLDQYQHYQGLDQDYYHQDLDQNYYHQSTTTLLTSN